MGGIVAKFRKEKTTEQILEKLENKIVEIEKYSINTKEQEKHFVFNFLAISVGVYVIAFIIFYFVYFPPTWKERIIYSVPLLLFPMVIFLFRKAFAWHFQRKLNKNSNKLKALRAEKKKILEDVMDKEKYKVAVSLLARFGDRSYGSKPTMSSSSLSATPKLASSSTSSSMTTTLAGLTNSSVTPNPKSSYGGGNQLNASRQTALTLTPRTTLTSNTNDLNVMPKYLNQQTPRQISLVAHTSRQESGQELRRRTPFPVLDWQNKGILDRIVDVLVGDGPKDRFAMICRECYAHNGMALKDDFDFTAFRCAFCNAMNPARKKRQVAPPLLSSTFHQGQLALDQKDSSDSSSTSSEDLPSNYRKSSIKKAIKATLQDTHSQSHRRDSGVADHDHSTVTSNNGEQVQPDLIDLTPHENNETNQNKNPDIDDDDSEFDYQNILLREMLLNSAKNDQVSQESNPVTATETDNTSSSSKHDKNLDENVIEKIHE